MHRIFLTTSDLQIITGTGYDNCSKIMRTLKDSLGKKSHQHVTIKEYCNYENISESEVLEAIGLKKPEKV